MIVSHTNKFAILMPWKSASSTLHARFESINESRYSRFYHFSPHLNRVTHQHVTCAEFAALPEARLGYRTAAFIRNPYDRVYSGFIQVQRDLRDQIHAPFPADWIRELVLHQLAENCAQLARADGDFNRWVADLRDDQVLAVGRNTSLPLHPVHYWTHLCGQPYVSFIGRVECFEADLKSFCAEAGLDIPAPVDRNVSEGLETTGGDYRYIERMDGASIAKIERLFEEDFRLFGYRKMSTAT